MIVADGRRQAQSRTAARGRSGARRGAPSAMTRSPPSAAVAARGRDVPSPAAPLRLRDLDAVALAMPLPAAVRTPMGVVADAVALLVRATDDDGVVGWGEIWCQFPRFGMHHRARLLRDVFRPLAVGQAYGSPADLWKALTTASDTLRLQAGEPGPIAAVVAGIDIAAWDIAARRAGQPLWRWLGGAHGDVAVYASIGRGEPALERVGACLADGVRAVKLRSTGGVDEHLAVVRPVRERHGTDFELMLDLNASWQPSCAVDGVAALAEAGLAWLEEPLPVDAPPVLWRRLAAAAPMKLAGGENMVTAAAFDAALDERVLGVLQPDPTKWGGFSGCVPLAARIVAAGRRFCPHIFAGAPGVLAAAHLLAASNAPDGLLEWPVSHNPARDAMLAAPLRAGRLDLGDAPGLGFDPDPALVARYRVDV